MILCFGFIRVAAVGSAGVQFLRRTMQLNHMLVVVLVLAHCSDFSSAANISDVELQSGWQPPLPDLKLGAEDERGVVESLNSVREEESDVSGKIVSAWNEQVLKLNELTQCISVSETGNAIERWLDSLASLEEAPVASIALKPSQATPPLPDSTDVINSDAEVNASLVRADYTSMNTFDPLSVGSARSQTLGTSDGVSDRAQSSVGDEMAQDRRSDDGQGLHDAALLEEEGSGAEAGASSGGGESESVVHIEESGVSASPDIPDHQISSEGTGSPDEGITEDALDVRRSSSKQETDISSVPDSRSLESSDCDEDGGRPEVPTEALGSSKRTLNLLDALKLAACLSAAVTLMWRKRGRLRPCEEEDQAVLSEGTVEDPCPSTTGFSMISGASSNTQGEYPAARVGSLSKPLGTAIATVMAEALQQEHVERAPRTADELSQLLEAAMTESLSPVIGRECPGFVEQFKESFRSTYRLLGSVRNASARKPAPSSFLNHSGDFSRRRSEGSAGRYHRRTDDEDDDNNDWTSSSRVAYLDPVFESDSLPHRRVDPDSESDLAAKLSRLTFSAKRPGAIAHSRHGSTVPSQYAKHGTRDGAVSSDVDDEAFGDIDGVSSPLQCGASERLSENATGDGRFQVHQSGRRRSWGRSVLEQVANVGGAEGVASPPPSEQQQGGVSFILGELDLALQPSSQGQRVAASESSLSHHGGGSHYKQQKIVLMQQEMHLRKMELAYKFRDLHLQEARLELSSDLNSLMRETVDLSRNCAESKEAEFQDRKLAAAYTELAKRCADEMVAGLFVMLCALFFGVWKYSYGRLVDMVSACEPTYYEPSNSYVPGFNKLVDSINYVISHLHMLACEVTMAGRMFVGLGIICVVAASLLRKSVTSNSQTVPATILIVVIGGICGCAGKFAVDSIGGSGYHWLLLWETFCLVHTFATCFTPTLFNFLHGTPPSDAGELHGHPFLMRPWWRRFWFHVTTVLVLPILTGLLPFAHVREIVELLALTLWNLAYLPLKLYLEKVYQFHRAL